MASINNPEFRAHNNALSPDGHRGMRTANEQQTSPTLVAYVFIMPKEADLTLETIRNLMPQGIFTSVIGLPMAQEAKASTDDSWLQHPAAAEYLGISESTLYRYAEHQTIESRKLCGRLQYRLSQLDKFKEQHVRPARRPLRNGVIISGTPSSGK